MNNTSNHTVDDIYRILAKHNALIVHFSGTPKGAGNGINNFFYPDDLKNVIEIAIVINENFYYELCK